MTAKGKLRALLGRFQRFHQQFSPFFETKTRDNRVVSKHYLKGLVQTPRRNMERMEEKVPDSNEQALQHFITNSPWNERAVLNEVAKQGDRLLGGKEDSCLLIDETSFPKKGKNSVGVIRQYCGRTGKIDNCQVAVFAALSSGNKSLPIDFRLYLPVEWTDDKERCLKAGIPREKIELKTKCKQAIDIIRAAKENGVRFNWVGADAGYGKDPGFLEDLINLDLTFVADVHKSQIIYFENPTAETKSQSLNKWVAQQNDWKTITVRQCTQGKLVFEYLHVKVWIKIGHQKSYREVQLIVRRNRETKDDLKFSVSNASDSVPLQRLVFMQGQRFWIERAFEDSKGCLGMGEYQIRKWNGLNHHLSLVLLAHLFLLKERILNEKDFPLLSCQDIVALLEFYLPKRALNEKEIFRQMALRHRKRREDIERKRLRQSR